MGVFTLLFLAVGLSADAFAVAVAHGAASKRLLRSDAIRMSIFFGAFQAIMPAIGWFVGQRFQHLIAEYDHWIAFSLLAGIGGKMIWDDLAGSAGEDDTGEPIALWRLVTLAVATSIDALAVGAGLLFLPSIAAIAVTIGAVTFAISLAGVLLGHRFRSLARSRSKAFGGVILILIGTRILLDHLGMF